MHCTNDTLTQLAQLRTFAVRLHDCASFFTSSTVGSRCILYFARGCHRSYCACKFLPARPQAHVRRVHLLLSLSVHVLCSHNLPEGYLHVSQEHPTSAKC